MLQDQLNNLLTDTFIDWKGGEFQYSKNDEIRFETEAGSYFGDYLMTEIEYLSTDILVLRFAEMEEIDEI